MSRGCVACATILTLLASSPVIAANPDIGMPGDLEDTDVFTFPVSPLAWQLTIYSYAFEGTAGDDRPDPAIFPDPGPGQTLFVYVLEAATNEAAFPAPVDQFVVGNPIPVTVLGVGHSIAITPAGFTGTRQDPAFSFSSEDALSVFYSYEGANTIEPSTEPEFSVVWFVADAPPGFVQGSVQGGAATTDVQEILGPVPEPATLMLLAAGALFIGARRGRRSEA